MVGLVMILSMPQNVYAAQRAETVTAIIPVEMKAGGGTVKITSLDTNTSTTLEVDDKEKKEIKIDIHDSKTYEYQVEMESCKNPKAVEDDTVYQIHIIGLRDEKDNHLYYPVVVIENKEKTHKPEEIYFNNKLPEEKKTTNTNVTSTTPSSGSNNPGSTSGSSSVTTEQNTSPITSWIQSQVAGAATGDDSKILFWLAGIVASTIVLIIFCIGKKRQV